MTIILVYGHVFFKLTFFAGSKCSEVMFQKQGKSHRAWKEPTTCLFESKREKNELSQFQKTKFLASVGYDL